MFRKILVPTDGSPLSEKVVGAALNFADENDGEIVALSVVEPYRTADLPAVYASVSPDWQEHNERAQLLARQHVDHIVEMARKRSVACETSIVLSFSPCDKIIEAAGAFHCDIIFMGTHGRKGVDWLINGSETRKVLAYSTVPVLVFH